QGLAVRDDTRRIGIHITQASQQTPLARARHTLVTTTQNRDPAAAALQSASKLLYNRRLARAADGQVADADDKTAERPFANHALRLHTRGGLHGAGHFLGIVQRYCANAGARSAKKCAERSSILRRPDHIV